MANILKKMFDNDKHVLKKFNKQAKKVEALSEQYNKYTDEQLRAKTASFRERLAYGETLEDILVEAFATVLA